MDLRTMGQRGPRHAARKVASGVPSDFTKPGSLIFGATANDDDQGRWIPPLLPDLGFCTLPGQPEVGRWSSSNMKALPPEGEVAIVSAVGLRKCCQ